MTKRKLTVIWYDPLQYEKIKSCCLPIGNCYICDSELIYFYRVQDNRRNECYLCPDCYVKKVNIKPIKIVCIRCNQTISDKEFATCKYNGDVFYICKTCTVEFYINSKSYNKEDE